jgi:hypothetical protein
VGCAIQTIRTFEIGKRRPSRELTERLADVLQVPQEQRSNFVRAARIPASLPSVQPAAGEQKPVQLGERRDEHAGSTTDGRPASGLDATKDYARLDQVPILATKLYMPRPRARLVSRSRLLAQLEAGLSGVLTVIAAPAGFGKTTVLADWLSQKAATARHVAWLALDAGDSEPHQFVRYLIAALQTIAPAIGDTTLKLLRAAQTPPIGTLLPLLLNDLVQLPEGSILILDDYHVIDTPAVHQALAFLIDHLPPQLHLIIASRADPPLPLSRLRARGQLTELRAHDLRFAQGEAATFLHEVMGLPLSVEDVAALEARTEGWIAGLQLAALSLRDRPNAQRANFIAAFTGSHHFVVDYLVDEVLARQSPHLQTSSFRRRFLNDCVVRFATRSCLGMDQKRNRQFAPRNKRIVRSCWRSWSATTCSLYRWMTSGAGIATIISSHRSCGIASSAAPARTRWQRCTVVPVSGSSSTGSSQRRWSMCSPLRIGGRPHACLSSMQNRW